MLKGYWRDATATFVLAAIIASIALGLIWELGLIHGQRRQSDISAQKHSQITQNYIETVCLPIGGPAAVECVTKAVNAGREDQRAENDLQAQQQMAKWAFWLLIGSVVSVGAGIYGILLLRDTLRETKQATIVAQAQVRAYLTPENLDVFVTSGRPTFQIAVRNSGLSPARFTQVVAYAQMYGRDGATFGAISYTKALGTIGAGMVETSPWGQFADQVAAKAGTVIVFTVGIFGKDVFGIGFEEFETVPIMVQAGGDTKLKFTPDERRRILPEAVDVHNVDVMLRSVAWSEDYLVSHKPANRG